MFGVLEMARHGANKNPGFPWSFWRDAQGCGKKNRVGNNDQSLILFHGMPGRQAFNVSITQEVKTLIHLNIFGYTLLYLYLAPIKCACCAG
jgi:hypothetical protein